MKLTCILYVVLQMSPLNNNTLSSSGNHQSNSQLTSSSSAHHHHLTDSLMTSSNGQSYSSKPSPGSLGSSGTGSSSTASNVNVNDGCSSPSSAITSSGSLIPSHMTSSVVQAVTAADNWTAALSRSAGHHHHPMSAATAAFGGHGFAGMYGWY